MRQFKLRERLGFEFLRQKGSHVVLKKQTPDGAVGFTVPLSRQLAAGTKRRYSPPFSGHTRRVFREFVSDRAPDQELRDRSCSTT